MRKIKQGKRDIILFYMKYFIQIGKKGLSYQVIFEQRPKKVREYVMWFSVGFQHKGPQMGTQWVFWHVSKEASCG